MSSLVLGDISRIHGYEVKVNSRFNKIEEAIKSFSYKELDSDGKESVDKLIKESFRKATYKMLPLKGSDFNSFANKKRILTTANESWNVGWSGKPRKDSQSQKDLASMVKKSKIEPYGSGFVIKYDIPARLQNRLATIDQQDLIYKRDIISGFGKKNKTIMSKRMKGAVYGIKKWIETKGINTPDGKDAIGFACMIVNSWAKSSIGKPKTMSIDAFRLTRNENAKNEFNKVFSKKIGTILANGLLNNINKNLM